MRNTIKVLKDNMTMNELRATDLENVCDLERGLIEIILQRYEDDDNAIVDFDDDDVVAIGCINDEFYITYSDDATNITIECAINLIETGTVADWWNIEWNDEFKYAREIISALGLYIKEESAIKNKDIVIFINEEDFTENTSNRDYNDYTIENNEFGNCEYENEDYNFYFNREQNGDFNYISLVKSELVKDAA